MKILDPDSFAEIWSTLTRHKLRTFLTGLSVAWGVFMLIVLLGAGKGLENGATDTFSGDALNAVWINTGTTSIPFADKAPGRKSSSTTATTARCSASAPASSTWTRSSTFRAPSRSGTAPASTFLVRGAVPDVRYLENTKLREGRLLNEDDQRQRRKVTVIGPLVVDVLFGNKSPIGEYVQVRGSIFRVVGVYEDPFGIDDDQRNLFVPLSTVQLLNGSTSKLEGWESPWPIPMKKSARNWSKRCVRPSRIATTTRGTIGGRQISSATSSATEMSRMFVWIRVFVWLVGIGTLLAGIVGVSNIMLISVKERTQEIGIRKAIGATPGSIVRMIVAESLLITGIAGYVGLAAGIGAIGLAATYMPSMKYLRDPSVNFNVALGATVLIVVAGTLAGLFPARQAASTHPITALRTE